MYGSLGDKGMSSCCASMETVQDIDSSRFAIFVLFLKKYP